MFKSAFSKFISGVSVIVISGMGVSFAQPSPDEKAPLKLYWSSERGDNYTTTGEQNGALAIGEGYRLVRTTACLAAFRQIGSFPLETYYSPDREEHITVATDSGKNSAIQAGYHKVRTEGYVFREQRAGTVPLNLFWSGERQDNFTTATPAGRRDASSADYQNVRVEGFAYPASDCAPELRASAIGVYDEVGLSCPLPFSTNTSGRSWVISERKVEHEGQWAFECTYRHETISPDGDYHCAPNRGSNEEDSFECVEIGLDDDLRIMNQGDLQITSQTIGNRYFDLEAGTGHGAPTNQTRKGRELTQKVDFGVSNRWTKGDFVILPLTNNGVKMFAANGFAGLSSPAPSRSFCENATQQSGTDIPPPLGEGHNYLAVNRPENIGRSYCMRTVEGNVGFIRLIQFQDEGGDNPSYVAFNFKVWRD